jgi:hypothetical protein
MSKPCRSALLYTFSIAAVTLFATAASADDDCYTTCAPNSLYTCDLNHSCTG